MSYLYHLLNSDNDRYGQVTSENNLYSGGLPANNLYGQVTSGNNLYSGGPQANNLYAQVASGNNLYSGGPPANNLNGQVNPGNNLYSWGPPASNTHGSVTPGSNRPGSGKVSDLIGDHEEMIRRHAGKAKGPKDKDDVARKYGRDLIIHHKAGVHRGEERKGVVYASLQDRISKYKVTLAGKLTRGFPPTTLDTEAAKKAAAQKYGALGNATLQEPSWQRKMSEDWAKRALIWVCVPIDGNDFRQSVFYSSFCLPHKYHHTTLSAGREVCGAGEWIVEHGKLRKISANSGHYQPSLSSLHQCVLALSCAWQEDTTVLLWNVKDGEYEDVPVKDFARDSDGGGKYKSHPRA